MLISRFVCFAFLAIAVATALAEEAPISTLASPAKSQLAEKPAEDPASPAAAKTEISDAERIADLRQTVEAEQARLKELEAESNDPASEYAKAENDFRELNRELDQKRESLEKLKADGQSAAAVALEKELVSIEKQRKLAKERFELALEERKTRRDETATLRRKVQLDQEALDELTGTKPKRDEDSKSSDRKSGRHQKSAEEKDSPHDRQSGDAEKKSDEKDNHDDPADKAKSEEKSGEDDA